MVWLWVALAVPALLIATPFAVGTLLSPPFRVQAERVVHHPPAAVWQALSNIEAIPIGGQQCRGVEMMDSPSDRPVWKEDLGTSVVTVETVETQPPLRVVRQLSDSVVPLRIRCEYTVTETDGGSLLRASGEGTVERGTWHAPVFRFLIKGLGMGSRGQADYLRRVAESLDRS